MGRQWTEAQILDGPLSPRQPSNSRKLGRLAWSTCFCDIVTSWAWTDSFCLSTEYELPSISQAQLAQGCCRTLTRRLHHAQFISRSHLESQKPASDDSVLPGGQLACIYPLDPREHTHNHNRRDPFFSLFACETLYALYSRFCAVGSAAHRLVVYYLPCTVSPHNCFTCHWPIWLSNWPVRRSNHPGDGPCSNM